MLTKKSQRYQIHKSSETPGTSASKTAQVNYNRGLSRPPPPATSTTMAASINSNNSFNFSSSWTSSRSSIVSSATTANYKLQPPIIRRSLRPPVRPKMGVPMMTSTPARNLQQQQQQKQPQKHQELEEEEEEEPIYCEIPSPCKAPRAPPLPNRLNGLGLRPPPTNLDARHQLKTNGAIMGSSYRPTTGLGRRAITQLDMSVTSRRPFTDLLASKKASGWAAASSASSSARMDCIQTCKYRRQSMKTTEEFWAKRQHTDSSAMESWISARNPIGQQYCWSDTGSCVSETASTTILPNHLKSADMAAASNGLETASNLGRKGYNNIRSTHYGLIDWPVTKELPDHRRIINTKKASQIANKKSPGILRKKMTKESPINYSHDSGVDSMNTNSSGSMMSSSVTSRQKLATSPLFDHEKFNRQMTLV